MARPYRPVVVLHLVIRGGGCLVTLRRSPAVALALLVILKRGLDLLGHLKDHAAARQAGQPVNGDAV